MPKPLIIPLLFALFSCGRADSEKARDMVVDIIHGNAPAKYWVPKDLLPNPESTNVFDYKNSINNSTNDVSGQVSSIETAYGSSEIDQKYTYGGIVPQGYIKVTLTHTIKPVIYPWAKIHGNIYILHSWLEPTYK